MYNAGGFLGRRGLEYVTGLVACCPIPRRPCPYIHNAGVFLGTRRGGWNLLYESPGWRLLVAQRIPPSPALPVALHETGAAAADVPAIGEGDNGAEL